MKSEILKNIDKRQDEFLPNPELDKILLELKRVLEPVQKHYNTKLESPRYPVLGVVGLSRSGTTLISQLLAATSLFAYPTNLLARFSYSSKVGAMIQEVMFNEKLDFRGEFSDIQSNISLKSWQGKTSGALGVNEFFHFWRRFFPNYEPGFLPDKKLGEVALPDMRAELAGIQDVFKKPFLSKAKMMQANASFFSSKMPELFFVHVFRKPRYVMQSLLMSRRAYYGNDNESIWWGSKPREYGELCELGVYEQVAGQTYYVEKGLREELANTREEASFSVSYEELCSIPFEVVYEVLRKSSVLDILGADFVERTLRGVDFSAVKNANHDKLSTTEIDCLLKAYDNFASGDAK